MDDLFAQAARYVALGMDAGSAALIAAGAGQALYAVFAAPFRRAAPRVKRDVWLHFGGWLLLGLEFELGADVIKTAISPGWTEIGQLGAIAVIRVFLNYFLQQDMERYAAR
ncbi:MAG TPA: DUF1622 domain-containing protein [Candidatus Acidoferrales bacterium]|jgi:uncharacterized membrane protein|nr:DUF1622 domain-containing protein [Candidatus Acidoferrales bacterium]